MTTITNFADLNRYDQHHLRSVGRDDLAADGWPEPDMTIVNPERSPAPVMSDEDFNAVFGHWADWIRSAAAVKNAPTDYVALALLSTASAIIGNTRWAVPWDGWKEPPILWGMLVGDPSSGKSPALDAVLDPLKDIDAALSRQFEQDRAEWSASDELAGIALAQWKSEAKAALAEGEDAPPKPSDAGPAPIRKRVRISDVTTEKVAELVQATWRGLLLSRDELSGWIASMDRYSGGGDRPFWLEAFGGRSYTVDRKTSPDPIIVDHLAVAVLGGTQPDKLDSLLVRSDDDGMVARILTVIPDPVPLQRPTVAFDTETPLTALRRLHSLQGAADEHGNLRPFFVHFSDDAAHALDEFRAQCRAWEADVTGLMKGHVGKLPGLAVRVSLVLALLDWAIDPNAEDVTSISASHLGRACHYVGDHLRLHALRAYGTTSLPTELKAARRLGEIILRERITQISTRDVQRRQLAGLQSAKEIAPAFTALVDAGWLALMPSENGGRPSKKYAVNPHLEDAR